MSKIFIIGLPRTGTTSVCHAFLEFGIATAHTAYTSHCFENATAIA
ncbi:sulfotransferase, partial [Pseudoalteromonas sp. TB51]